MKTIKQLNKEALPLFDDFKTLTRNTAIDYIMDTTSTSGGPLGFSELCDRILDDIENIDWVLTEKYYVYVPPHPLDENKIKQFDQWKAKVLEKIERENAAVDRLNALASFVLAKILADNISAVVFGWEEKK